MRVMSLEKQVHIVWSASKSSSDAYISVVEALKTPVMPMMREVKINWVDVNQVTAANASSFLKCGWDYRPGRFWSKRKLRVRFRQIRYAREQDVLCWYLLGYAVNLC